MSVARNRQQTPLNGNDPDKLIGLLRARGVNYLVSTVATKSPVKPVTDVALLKSLIQCPYPRVRDACISLFLLHPDLSKAALQVYATGDGAIAEQMAVLVLATLYLQRLWHFQLTFALGHEPAFPEQSFVDWWKNRHLPAPQCQYGEAGLLALQAMEQQRRGLSLNFIGDWQNQVDHLLLQEAAKYPQHVQNIEKVRREPLLKVDYAEDQECGGMSMRHNVAKADIEQFLKSLGKTFRKPGRLYLVGGAALVHMGLRPGVTMDINVTVEADDEDDMITAIRRLVTQMQINVEFASPGDFIPLPSQWMAQARYVGRYGLVDVFYFDFYSLALSKISRGSDRDLVDVKLLLQQNAITLEGLDAAYGEVLPRMGKRPYINVNPQRFAERYAEVRQQLQND